MRHFKKWNRSCKSTIAAGVCDAKVIAMFLSRLEDHIGKGFIGAFVGAFVGAALGYGLGFLGGWINETTLKGDDFGALYLGRAEFAPMGLAWFGFVNCAAMGAVGGMLGAMTATIRRNFWLGMLGAVLAVALGFFVTGLFLGPVGFWHEPQIVWLIGSVLSSMVGPICARLVQRNEERAAPEAGILPANSKVRVSGGQARPAA